MTWQSIETAPRDETHIDLWAGGRRYPDSHWEQEDEDEIGHWYCAYQETPSSSFAIGEEPTHWMPIPAPPRD